MFSCVSKSGGQCRSLVGKVVSCYKCGGCGHLARVCSTPDELGPPRKNGNGKRSASSHADGPLSVRVHVAPVSWKKAYAQVMDEQEQANGAVLEEELSAQWDYAEADEPYVPEEFILLEL